MTAPNAKDGFEKLLATGLRRSAGSGDGCPDAEILAAYFEHSLSQEESQGWEAHFSGCARCQLQLAALVRSEPVPEAARQPFRLLTWRWLTPLAAATAALVLWVVMQPPQPITDSAENRTQAPPAATEAQRSAAEAPPAQPPAALAGKAAASRDAWANAAGEKRKAEAEADALSKQALASGKESAKTQAPSAAAAPESAPARVQEEAAGPRKTPAAAMDRKHMAETVQVQSAPAIGGREQKLEQKVVPAPASPAPAQATVRANEPRDEKNQSKELADSAKKRQATGAFEMRVGVAATALSGPPQFATPDRGMIWRYADKKLERSTDGAKTWEHALSLSHPATAAACPKDRICWVVGESGLVLRTTDGQKWEILAGPESANLIAVTPKDEKSATVTTVEGKSYQTSDAGKTWKPLP